MCQIVEGVMGCLLLVLAYEDWKKKRVSLWLLGLLLLVSVLGRVTCVSMTVQNTLGGIGLGLLLLGISRWCKEAIGFGDSLLAFALGIYLGGARLLEILSFASFLVCIYSLVYGLRHGWNRKRTMPYVPFVAISYIGGMFL